MKQLTLFALCCCFLQAPTLLAQQQRPKFLSLQPADTLYKARLWSTMGFGLALYGTTMTSLYKKWYKDYPTSKFHFFNDNKEWNQMDKMGHWLMSYNEARWGYMGANWIGMRHDRAAWMGFLSGQLIQTSFEVLDGISAEWGFSLGDVGFNALGSGLFLAQELAWKEQRISMKMSGQKQHYSNRAIYPVGGTGPTTTLQIRADSLYGTSPIDFFLKNYNTLTVWASFNIRSFMPKGQDTWVPRWLNVAVGMGAENLFAGFGYGWASTKGCAACPRYTLDPLEYPRTRQIFFSLDMDPSKIRTKNRFLRTFLYAANIIKIPAPTLEITDHGRVKFHPIMF